MGPNDGAAACRRRFFLVLQEIPGSCLHRRNSGDLPTRRVYSPAVNFCCLRRRRWILATIVCASAPSLRAQNPNSRIANSVQVLAEQGLNSLTVGPLDEAIALVDQALQHAPSDSVLLHYRGYAWYRKGSILFSQRRTKEAKAALDSAEFALTVAGKSLTWPENAALLGATLGQKIAVGANPITVMRLGRRSNAEMDRAAERGPNNPRVFLVRGIGALFKPRMFGGGVDRAAAELERAISYFQTDSALSPLPSWGQSEVYQWLGMTRARQGRVAEAHAAYLHVLDLNPGNAFVRDSLLPALPKDIR